MATTIDGIKYSSKELEGTDIDAIKKFCQKNKVKAAHIIYVDKTGMIESAGIWFNANARDLLQGWFKNK